MKSMIIRELKSKGIRKGLIIENNLREKDYSFNYEHVTSGAMFKYRYAFLKNDEERYKKYLEELSKGNVIDRNNDGCWVYVSVENGNKFLTTQIVSQTSIPIDINRDSIFNFISFTSKRHVENILKSI